MLIFKRNVGKINTANFQQKGSFTTDTICNWNVSDTWNHVF